MFMLLIAGNRKVYAKSDLHICARHATSVRQGN